MLFGRVTVDGTGDAERDPLIGRGLGGGEIPRATGDGIVPVVRGICETGDVGRAIPEVKRAT